MKVVCHIQYDTVEIRRGIVSKTGSASRISSRSEKDRESGGKRVVYLEVETVNDRNAFLLYDVRYIDMLLEWCSISK